MFPVQVPTQGSLQAIHHLEHCHLVGHLAKWTRYLVRPGLIDHPDESR